MLVQDHKEQFHLFEADSSLPIMPCPGLFLGVVPGMPDVLGTEAGLSNLIRRVAVGPLKDTGELVPYCAIQGFRELGMNLEEIKAELPSWVFIETVTNKVTQVGPQDMLNGGS